MSTFSSHSQSASGAAGSPPGGPYSDVAPLFPERGKWTEADYLALSTNRLVELSDGCLEVLPMPSKVHQRIVQFLYRMLFQVVSAAGGGDVFVAPLPVRLWPDKFREPDVVYVSDERGEFRGQPEGADFVIEVVSEGDENRKRDFVEKRDDYAKAKISEYWIVDPEQQLITVLALDGEAYRERGVFSIGDTVSSRLLDGFSVSVADIFAAKG